MRYTMPVDGNDIINDLLRPISEAVESIGITPLYLAKKLKSELNAKEVKAFQVGGEVVYSKKLIAWNIRQRARMDAHKLMGHYPAEKKEITGKDGNPVEFIVTVEDE